MDAVGSYAQYGDASGAPPNAFSALDSEQFIKIIFTELGNQDPLQPSDSKALLEQLSSLRSIQSDIDMSNRLDTLAGQFGTLAAQSELSAASSLIGTTIKGFDQDNNPVTGEVLGVLRTSQGAVLKLDGGKMVPMSRLDEVTGGEE